MTGELAALGFDVVPSAANFVFARHPGHDAATLAASLKEKEIFVRHFKLPRIDQHLRISIGTDAECDALVNALRDAGSAADAPLRVIAASLPLGSHQRVILRHQLLGGFHVRRVARNAFDRAHLLALRLVEVADALGALVRGRSRRSRAHRDRVVRALGLADVAVDALVGNHQRACFTLLPAGGSRLQPAPRKRRAGRHSRRRGVLVRSGRPCRSAVFDGREHELADIPPSCAISRTIVPEMNWYWSDGVMNIVSTSGSR